MPENADRAFSSVFHLTDFSASSHVAFEHALRIAVANRSHFTISHVETNESDGPAWTDFPQIRDTLERWAMLPEGSSRQAVGESLGIHVKKTERISKNPLQAISSFLEIERADLVVLSTEGRDGLPGWLRPSFSEALVRRSLVATLFVPASVGGFVSHDKGEIALNRVLIPTDRKPYPGAGIDIAGGLLKSLNVQSPRIETLYVGDPAHMPSVNSPQGLACSFEALARPGKPVDEILRHAAETEADLIVMATEGRNGFLDALRGSTTEQIVRRAPCPILAVPTSS